MVRPGADVATAELPCDDPGRDTFLARLPGAADTFRRS